MPQHVPIMRCKMTRFFFDYTAKEQSLLDYGGHEFRSSQAAIDFAQAIAQDLRHSLNGNWLGWSVEVRNAKPGPAGLILNYNYINLNKYFFLKIK